MKTSQRRAGNRDHLAAQALPGELGEYIKTLRMPTTSAAQALPGELEEYITTLQMPTTSACDAGSTRCQALPTLMLSRSLECLHQSRGRSGAVKYLPAAVHGTGNPIHESEVLVHRGATASPKDDAQEDEEDMSSDSSL